jgi:hypothetical protein
VHVDRGGKADQGHHQQQRVSGASYGGPTTSLEPKDGKGTSGIDTSDIE